MQVELRVIKENKGKWRTWKDEQNKNLNQLEMNAALFIL